MVKLTQTLSYQQIESQHQYIVDSIYYYCLIMKTYNQLYQANFNLSSFINIQNLFSFSRFACRNK